MFDKYTLDKYMFALELWEDLSTSLLFHCLFKSYVINPVKHNIGSNHIIKKSIFKQYF